MTDQARDFIAKYMGNGRMCSPYSQEWMADRADRQAFEPERVNELMRRIPEFEGHLLVLDVSQAEVEMVHQLAELFPGLGRWFVQLARCSGLEPKQVYFNLSTQQVMAVAVGPQAEIHTYDAIAERPCQFIPLYGLDCEKYLSETEIEFGLKFNKFDFMNVIPLGICRMAKKSIEADACYGDNATNEFDI